MNKDQINEIFETRFDANKSMNHTYYGDQQGGIEIRNKATGMSVYLQPGDDANKLYQDLDLAANVTQADEIMGQYDDVMTYTKDTW